MVRVSYDQKPYRRVLMETWGASVVPSPSPDTNAGRAALAADPGSPGSLGLAISEAVEDAATREDTKYSLGSVLNHVLMHQTVIGLEAKQQLALAGEPADILIACVGGGSNFSGFTFPFLQDKLTGKAKDLRVIAVEPMASPSLTKGLYVYDFGDAAMTTRLKIHARPLLHARADPRGRLHHGVAPAVAALYDAKGPRPSPCTRTQRSRRLSFARTEGYLRAGERHAIRVVIDEALGQGSGPAKTIAQPSGHGHFDSAPTSVTTPGRRGLRVFRG